MRLKAIFLLIASLIIGSCVSAPQNGGNTAQMNSPQQKSDPNRKLKIGFAMDTLKEEHWQRDRDAFEAHCKKMNVECVIKRFAFADKSAHKNRKSRNRAAARRNRQSIIAKRTDFGFGRADRRADGNGSRNAV